MNKYPEQYIYDKNNLLIGHSPITIVPTGKFPPFAFAQWNTFEDLMSFVRDEKSTAIPGMVVTVVNDKVNTFNRQGEYVDNEDGQFLKEGNGVYIIDSVGPEGSVHRLLNTEEFDEYIKYIKDYAQTYVAGDDILDWWKTEQIGDIEAGLNKNNEKIFGQSVNHMLDLLLYPTLQPVITQPTTSLEYMGETCVQVGTLIPNETFFPHSYDVGGAYTSTNTNPDGYVGEVSESWVFTSPSNEHSYTFGQAMDEDGVFTIRYDVSFGDGPKLYDNKGFDSTIDSFISKTISKEVEIHVVKPIYVNDGIRISDMQPKLVDYYVEDTIKVNVDIVSETEENKFEIHVPVGFKIDVKQYNTISDSYNIPIEMQFTGDDSVHDSTFGTYSRYIRTHDETDIQGSSKYQITITRQ